MKKLLGLILAGAMVLSMSVFVFAAGDGETEGTEAGGTGETDVTEGTEEGGASGTTVVEKAPDTYTADDVAWMMQNSPGFNSAYFAANWPKSWAAYLAKYGSSSETLDPVAAAEAEAAAVEAVLQEQYASESEANALAAEAIGLSMATLNEAAELNKSVGEYFNNSVNSAPGLDHATPVSQGGNVIINGVPSNQTFSVYKPLMAHVDAAKAQAAALGGRVMNVVDIDASVYFNTATVNFYMPGVTGAENIQVYHFANGTWTPVNVAEVRLDHVVVDMTSLGIIAFIEVPAAQ